MPAGTAIETLILGLGNILWADEGFGVRCVEEFNRRYAVTDDARVMDGGTQGLFLLPWVSEARRLLIFDAVDFGLDPGELRLIRDGDVPSYMGVKKMSMHQTGFQEVLASSRLITGNPRELALIGVQPEVLDDYGGSLRDLTRACIPRAVELALAVLGEWRVEVRERREPLAPPDHTGPSALRLASYENRWPL